MRYFTLDEFDSPDRAGSGEMMEPLFLETLDEARAVAAIPFKITSGFRTVEYNQSLILRGLPASKQSSHLLGLAADIHAPDSRSRFIILDALMEVGVTRFGIGETYIHCDVDPFKPSNRIWIYS